MKDYKTRFAKDFFGIFETNSRLAALGLVPADRKEYRYAMAGYDRETSMAVKLELTDYDSALNVSVSDGANVVAEDKISFADAFGSDIGEIRYVGDDIAELPVARNLFGDGVPEGWMSEDGLECFPEPEDFDRLNGMINDILTVASLVGECVA